MTQHMSGPADLHGRVALITGGAGAMGRAIANAFSKAGARVVATDLAQDESIGEGIAYRRYDVTSREQTDALIDAVIAEHGKVDILVLCAGIIARTSLADSTDEEWDALMAVNVRGVVNPTRKLFPLMCAQGYGKILAAGSIAAKNGGVASGPAYVASKSAVHGMIRWMAKAGAPHGVYANTLAPGPVETAMWASVTTGGAPAANATVPLGRYGNPEDIAQAALFLCSPASNWITGTSLDISGGMWMD
ncbi:SDR family NAD(P)-dependent oxidoreductase [Parapusillimonas granuli]|uniref:SDR family oxidoreductase n=1 Tax=Parapusillimonas granuli TaxID=380911 RepID=A0A853G3G7_9BURK|nr:SDR family oxidoreductase [Parapusillimonas granuli]MBB5214309.1 3-oxoacyl-[acyl-carrier protein] reductase [Parapusillimonas granuli]MEB2399122.1 SDR family NAD(P)-dependent oxidoreductase [Alcaligenaceae bacterium]NYT51413.1 SDR family oxidoreductase [Parapusillimonas granuli]